jgi:hypothetical protein
MLLLVSLLSLGIAIQIAELMYVPGETPSYSTTTYSTGSLFDGLPKTDYFTVHTWVSFFEDSTSLVDIWMIQNDNNEQLTIRRKFPDSILVSKDSNSIPLTRSLQKFKWTFISLSMRLGSTPTFCSSDWGANSLTCDQLPYALAFAFTANPGTIQVTQANEMYDFQLVLRDLNEAELKSIVLATGCHSACTSCIGPSYNACEFIPIVRPSHLIDYTYRSVGEYELRDKNCTSVDSLALTGWVRINFFSAGGDSSDILRFSTKQ